MFFVFLCKRHNYDLILFLQKYLEFVISFCKNFSWLSCIMWTCQSLNWKMRLFSFSVICVGITVVWTIEYRVSQIFGWKFLIPPHTPGLLLYSSKLIHYLSNNFNHEMPEFSVVNTFQLTISRKLLLELHIRFTPPAWNIVHDVCELDKPFNQSML